MFVAHFSEYMYAEPSMSVLKARTAKNAIIEAFGIKVGDGEDIDRVIKGTLEGNGDGMPLITILDTRTNKVITG